jgi:hypothetical protein
MHVAESNHWRVDHHQVNSGNIDVYAGGANGYGAAQAQAHKPIEDEASLSVVQLRGLPYRATVQDIMGFLGHHGSNLRDGAKSVQLVPNHKGRPSGFAKLYFNTPKAATACRDELHLCNLEDRYVEVFLCSDWPDRKQGARQRSRVGKQDGLHNMSYNGENYNAENIPHVAVPQLIEVEDVKEDIPPSSQTCTPSGRGQRIDMDVAHIKNKVKNTFLEFGVKDKALVESRRTRSDITSDRQLHMSPEHDVPKSPTSPYRDNYLVNGKNESPDRNGNNEPAYLIPMTPSPLLHSSAPPSDLIIPPFGYCADGMMLDDAALPPSFEEMELYGLDGNGVENPYLDYLTQGQFFPDMYCDNFVPDGTGMQGWDATGMGGVTLPDGACTAGDAAWDAPPTLDDVDMSNNWENFDIDQDCSSGSSKRDSSGDRWADSMSNGRAKSDRYENGLSKKSNDGDIGGEEHGQSRDRRAVKVQNQAHMPDVGGSNLKPGSYTTVMLRNIPNKYTREMLVKVLNQSYKGHYDFMYLPIDFKNKCNVGYGFVNFRTSEACQRFIKQFDGVDVRQCLPGINSKKVAEVTPARQQGLTENVRRLRNSPVMNQLIDHPEWMPLILDKNGNAENFPLPDQAVPPIKPRGKPQSDKLCN